MLYVLSIFEKKTSDIGQWSMIKVEVYYSKICYWEELQDPVEKFLVRIKLLVQDIIFSGTRQVCLCESKFILMTISYFIPISLT